MAGLPESGMGLGAHPRSEIGASVRATPVTRPDAPRGVHRLGASVLGGGQRPIMSFVTSELGAVAKAAAASVAGAFKALLSNLAVDNADTISLRYGEITCALNQEFRDTDSKTANSLQVGSYGRWTAIKGISDLD
eukprot:gene20855-26488_t